MTSFTRSRSNPKKVYRSYGSKERLREITHRLVLQNKRRLARETPEARKAKYALQRKKRLDRKRHEKEFH